MNYWRGNPAPDWKKTFQKSAKRSKKFWGGNSCAHSCKWWPGACTKRFGPLPVGSHKRQHCNQKAEVRSSFNTTTVQDEDPRSHHKGTTGRVQTGDRLYLVLCHCQLGQGIPATNHEPMPVIFKTTVMCQWESYAWKRMLVVLWSLPAPLPASQNAKQADPLQVKERVLSWTVI